MASALSPRNRMFLRKVQAQERNIPLRVLTASASSIDFGDKLEARRLRVLRQGWQIDAANYVDAIPELSFAYRFLAHAASRMRYFPALVNPDEPDGVPMPAQDVPNVPQGVIDCMNEAMDNLGTGRVAITPLQKSLSWQFGVTGECFLICDLEEPPADMWKIRSIEEFQVFGDGYKIRDVPLDPQGVLGWHDLKPETTFATRLWVPSWRFQLMAMSPMKALLDVSEELLLLSRDVRAVARSRLAGSGILKIPENLRMLSTLEDNEDPEANDWFADFADAMMTPLADEGVASAVVPIGISGDAESLAQLDHLIIDRPYSAMAMELRAECIGRMATGLDFPREILEGIGDVNHWSGALVSDETFRHHIEPQVIEQVDAMTIGFLRAWMTAAGMPEYWVDRACIWYDPSDLISAPDPMDNAIKLWDREALSNAALLKAGGFGDSDAPDTDELLQRQLLKSHTLPPAVVLGIIHAFAPNLRLPPTLVGGVLPGLGPQTDYANPPPPPLPPGPDGMPPDPGTPPLPGEPPATPPAPAELPPAAPVPTPPTQPAAATQDTPAAIVNMPTSTTAESFAAAQPTADHVRLSRKLGEIDGQLRIKLQVAANAAMTRLLDRAGAKLRTRAKEKRFGLTASALSVIDGMENRRVAATLGDAVVASLGFANGTELINPDWSELKGQFAAWIGGAQQQALKTACQLAGIQTTSPAAHKAAGQMAAGVNPAWEAFEQELNTRAESLLYNPDPTGPEPTFDPNTCVPAGMVRRAMAIAGGATKAMTAAAGDIADTIDVTNPTTVQDSPPASAISVDIPGGGQIGTGDALSSMLADSGMEQTTFTWVHNYGGPQPFEPHDDLDGESFTSFDDDILANPDSFPENDYFFPGDHDGCFPAGTIVSGPAPAATTLRYWEGEMVEISLASGEFLTATPNHPILTAEGWIPIGKLGEGDEVIRCVDGEGITRLVPNDYQVPTGIEEVADAFGVRSDVTTRSVKVAPENFHSDGAGSEVTVVRTDGDLWDRLNAALDKPLSQQALTGADPVIGLGLTSESVAASGLKGIGETALGSVGSDSLGHEDGGICLGDEQSRGGLPTTTLDAGSDESILNGSPVDAERLGQGGFRLPGLVAPDKIIAVNRHSFSGLVYNLDTRVGWYIAGTTIVKNCGCDFTTIWGPVDDGSGTPDDTGGDTDDAGDMAADTGSSFLSDAMQGMLSGDTAEVDLTTVRADAMDEVDATAQIAQGNLENMGAKTIQRPPAMLAGKSQTGGEYDWYYQLSGDERDRLRNNGWIAADTTLSKPDQLVAGFISATGITEADVDQAMAYWLQQTRVVDAANLLSSKGALPANLARFGDFNWSSLTPNSTLDVAQVFGAKADAATYLAGLQENTAADLASRELTSKYGPAIYNMTFNDYQNEIETLTTLVSNATPIASDAEWGNTYAPDIERAINRMAELLPESLSPTSGDESYQGLWLEAQQVAKAAGLHG